MQVTDPIPFCAELSRDPQALRAKQNQPDRQNDLASSKNQAISQSLAAVWPSRQDMDTLIRMPFDSTIYLHQIWFNPDVDFSKGGRDVMQDLAHLPTPDTHPIILARRMLTMALFFQYFPPSANHGFSEDPRVITQRVADEAIKLVTTNEELHGWIESIDCILLEALYHCNYGNLRRAWLAMRRAMMVGQLMGLDRAAPPRYRVLDASRKRDPSFMWHNIVYQDRYLSLILGLPCGTADDMTEYEKSVQPGLTGSSWLSLELQHSRVTRRLLERANSSDPDANTQEIDNMLLRAAKSVPDDFWQVPNFEAPDNGQAAFWRTLRAMNQVKHYSLLNVLHLPYLLREDSERKYEPSKVQCVMASREILRRYNSYRGPKPILSCCRPLDFVALLAALTVMVAQMNVHRPGPSYSFVGHQRQSDRNLIEQVLTTMDRVAQVNDDAMTFQSACLLRRLMHLEADAFSGHCYLTEEVDPSTDGPDSDATKDKCNMDRCSVLHLDIPYFGKIRISRQVNQDAAMIRPVPSRSMPNSRVNMMSELPGTSQPPIAPYLVSGGQIDFSLTVGNEESLGPLEQMSYPDITATVDDWAFQGVDTAFFGSIMSQGNFNFGADDGLNSNWSQPFVPTKSADEWLSKGTRAFST